MAKVLYRVGRACARHGLMVIIAWLALLAVAVAGVVSVGGGTDEEFTIPGSESQQALDVLADTFPASSGTSAQLVFTAEEGQRLTDPASKEAIGEVLAAAGTAPDVATVIDPFTAGTLTKDGSTALAQVQYTVSLSELAQDDADRLRETANDAAQEAGVDVLVGGDAFKSRGAEVSPVELVGVVVALIVLLITFGSALAAGLTLLPAFIGLGVGIAALLSLTDLVTISSTAVTLALMLGLAVGIDYALFIISRHRTQLAEGQGVHDSIGRATGTAGSAVVFAGLTVVIAMTGLAVVRIPFVTVMGLAASLTVLVAVLVAITLIPALLRLAGQRLRPAEKRRNSATGQPRPTLGRRWVGGVVRRPVSVVLVVALGLGAAAVPAMDLKLALPDNSTASPGSGEREAYDLIDKEFGPGFNGPLLMTVEPEDGGATPQELQQQAGQVRESVGAMADVHAVSPPRSSPNGEVAILTVVPGTGPMDEKTTQLVETLRADALELGAATDTVLAVTGTTAVAIDVSAQLSDSLVPFTLVVVGLALVLLLLVFRSVVVPLKAAAGFLLSVGTALGVVVVVFQWGWAADLLGVHTTSPIVSFLPIIVMAVLFGLAMDYEVFLVSSMREQYVHNGGRPLEAVTQGFVLSSKVVTAAALIMFSVFAAFATSHSPVVKPMALALAVGVLADAFLIRMTLVPAVLALTRNAAWWLPRRLDRMMPNIDVEGATLDGAHQDSGPPRSGALRP
ncbi:MMPL family transporter [Streptomyces parvus]|uniref:MMPL family transporter n=1 Tax=Streptomyces parvus TaxID=66428 RepID=A0A7K3S7D6_9ACTN|nr:MMPL family transporter [Streptomyces parvus]NEC23408.1 MMPL family transporter [Streptomyces parvus]